MSQSAFDLNLDAPKVFLFVKIDKPDTIRLVVLERIDSVCQVFNIYEDSIKNPKIILDAVAIYSTEGGKFHNTHSNVKLGKAKRMTSIANKIIATFEEA